MKRKALSTFGLIMNSLNIQTVSLSRALHVDASLISKWKTGDRPLSEKSVYFEDIVDYFLKESKKQGHRPLTETLMNLYPHIDLSDDSQIALLLRQALLGTPSYESSTEQRILHDGARSVPTAVFEGNAGKRAAILKLLDYAEAMTVPGTLIFINSEEYDWFLEDPAFSLQFTERIIGLLKRGFHSKFVIYYSDFKEHFLHFFNACSPLIFHRNVEWFFYEYYDESILNVSFFIVNQAVSLLSLSGDRTASTTMIFTDNSVVLGHEVLANHVLSKCAPLFSNFAPSQIADIVNDISHARRSDAFYSYLPAPAFISVNQALLKEVLENNSIDEENTRKCLELNNQLWEATSCYFSKNRPKKSPFIHIFQLEELTNRVKQKSFTSNSLTLLGGKSVNIRSSQYAQVLLNLADGLLKHNNMQIVLVSQKDSISLPAINCWCQKNSWLVQMDGEGFRSSEEISIVNTAAATLERCVRRVPPERREKEAVRQYLLDLANELKE